MRRASNNRKRKKYYAFGITYSWYHFLSRYFAMSCWAVPLNCCASFDIFSALSSSLFNLSPRSTISMCARLTSFCADVARVPSSWMFAFGPEINFATERFGLPLAVSPTVKWVSIIIRVVGGRQGETYTTLLDLCSSFRHRKVLWRNFPSAALASRTEDKVHPAYHYSFD